MSNCILGLFCFEGDAITFIDLIHDVRHLCLRFRIVEIKAMPSGPLACATDETKLWLSLSAKQR